MKKVPITDFRYGEQQAALDEIAAKLGVVAFRPDYHRAMGDKNTVLFYLKEDDAHNRKVDQQPTHYSRGEAEDLMKGYRGIEISPEYIYRDYFWCFENSDANGLGDFGFANRGKIDLRGPNWRERLEGHIRIALTRKLRTMYVRGTGGWLELREADDTLNDLNQDIIKAYRMAYGTAFLGSFNFYDEKRKRISAGQESVYEEYTGQPVYTFGADFVVPEADEELESLIRSWNSDELPKSGKEVDKISDRIDRLGGEHLIWT